MPFLWAMLFVNYEYTMTFALQKMLSFLLAPAVRLIGYKTWRPEYSIKWQKKIGR